MLKPCNRPWYYIYHELFILASQLSSAMGSVFFFHTRMEANHMTDHLAKQGVSRNGESVAWLYMML